MGVLNKKRSSYLLISIAFFLLAVSSIFDSVQALDHPIYVDIAVRTSPLISAVVLIVLSFIVESRSRSIRLGRMQKGVMIGSVAAALLFGANRYANAPYDLYAFFGFGPLTQYILMYLSVGLMVAVAAMMFSYIHVEGNRDMRAGMIGSLLIMSGWAMGALGIELGAQSIVVDMGYVLMLAVLVGYVVILSSSIRSRLTQERKPVSELRPNDLVFTIPLPMCTRARARSTKNESV
jgi:membrane-associated HD superfamily phosphohydrolase